MELRKLKTKDLGQVSKIIQKMDIQEEVTGMAVDLTGKTEEEINLINKQLGIKFVFILVENYWKAENEIFQLFANLTGKTKKEIENLEVTELIKLFEQLIQDDDFQVFFNLAAK